MSCEQSFEPKPSTSEVVLTFDFSPALQAGETLLSIVSREVKVIAGEDATPSAIWNGTAAIGLAGTEVQQPVKGGIPSCYYQITVVATTSASRTLTVYGVLPII